MPAHSIAVKDFFGLNSPKSPSEPLPLPEVPPSHPQPLKMGRVLGAILVVAALAEMAYGIVNFSAMPVYITAIGLDARWVGIIALAYLVSEGLLKSPFGVLGDHLGRKKLMLLGPCISTFTALLTPAFHNPTILILLRVLDGMGLAALWPAAFSLISDYAPPEKRATALSLFNISYMVGIAFGPALGGGINDAAQHFLHLPLPVAKQASFYVAAILFSITALIAYFALPAKEPHHDPSQAIAGEGGVNIADFKAMLKRMPRLLLLAFCAFLSVGLVMAYAKLFVIERFNLTEGAYGGLFVAPALIIAFASVPLGSVSDRIGKPRAVQVGLGMCTLGYWLLLAFPYRESLVALGSVVGLGFVIAFPALMASVSESCEANLRGSAMGAIGTAQGFGAILGVLFSGFLYKINAFPFMGVMVPEHGVPFVCSAAALTLAFCVSLFGLHSPSQPPIK